MAIKMTHEQMAAIPVDANGHRWARHDELFRITLKGLENVYVCVACSRIQRRDGKPNKPCRGLVVLT